ncbi:Flp family type IVb pilin [Microvirgula aerodenitrificans]|uniref:Flp family type IVb pilin n=1 Tax=Microvirgula aerodenitrificans TaxID=57480 RepID=UPI0028EA6B9D|nr:Flp family type IVb pilin [Microvirgula aerodenitrificans]
MKLKSFLKKFARDERGVSALEYAILAAVVAVAVVAIGPKITALYTSTFTKATDAVGKLDTTATPKE